MLRTRTWNCGGNCVLGDWVSTANAPICKIIIPCGLTPSGRADSTVPIRQLSAVLPAAAPAQVRAARLVGWMIKQAPVTLGLIADQ
ncbi:hypothetical protein DYGSA30_42760 [Dyella sp. GSA-30]|nr:hypothetical protein DYGSA30_42760 [Dyella sp. GSA-30]